MAKNDDGHFWGMVLAAAAVAVAGVVALIKSFRTSTDSGRSWEESPLRKKKSKSGSSKFPAETDKLNPPPA